MINQTNRICKIQGHEKYSVFHICTLMDCNQATRWCCPECLAKGVHNHNKSNNSHIQNTYEFQIKLRNEYGKLKKDHLNNQRVPFYNFLQNIKKACEMLKQSIINYRKQVEEQIILITPDTDEAKMEQYLCLLRDNNLDQLDDLQINELLKLSQEKVHQNTDSFLLLPLNNIKQQLGQIQLIIEDYQAKQNNPLHQNIAIKDIKYNIQVVDNSNQNYHASQISNNQQYLAYGGQQCLLKIFDIGLRKIIKEIQLQNYIFVCQFTKDSSLLFIGSYRSVIGYDVKQDFKEIYQHQIHTSHVYNLLTIENDYLITCSYDSIIKTEIKTNKQLFILKGHTLYIVGLDYNEKDQIIVSGSGDRSIKLWDCCNSSIIIDKGQSHNDQIRQVQFISNNLNILSLDLSGIINKWEIDLKNKDLIKIQSFSDNNKIFNFYQVNQNQNLLIICKGYFKILNQQGELLKQIEHKGDIRNIFIVKSLRFISIGLQITRQPQNDPNQNKLQSTYFQQIDQIILAIAQD